MADDEDRHVSAELDKSVANVARVYDFLLGGKDNFAADREAGERILEIVPAIRLGVREQRAVLRRAVRYLAGEAGIDQLVDIGSGLPTAGNVHEVAETVRSGPRVAYVDNDQVVLAHARALLATSGPSFAVDGDVRQPRRVLDSVSAGGIDLTRPVGLLLSGILHYVEDDEDPAGLIAEYRDALAPGSHMFIQHLVYSDHPAAAEVQEAMRTALGRGSFRTAEAVRRMLDGMELVAPGVTLVPLWRPDPYTPSVDDNPDLRLAVAGLARVTGR